MAKHTYFEQADYTARFEWGYEGVEHVGRSADIVVIIDVLSFTTCVDIVLGRGGVVFPYRFRDESAALYAQEKHAVCAGKRGAPISLSPYRLSTIEKGSRIVLPSPNGSTCSMLAQNHECLVIAACLRNAAAVAGFIRNHKGTVSLIACGERWENDALRPAFEDMLAAGAILDELPGYRISPEAFAALSVYRSAKDKLDSFLAECGSARELIGRGYPEDVAIASQLNVSKQVPILQGDQAYHPVM